ncbi:hypothetical protein WHR41_02250 [Cladosporium halotolerans]|uniref:NACHT domain-containing protein n=1 Tax=Cladosporium halotolerans TaxID=1052096 RepID=A0AB34KWD1_9PEZI
MNRGITYETVYLKNASLAENANRNYLATDLTELYRIALDLLAETAKMFDSSSAKRFVDSIWKQGHVAGGLASIDDQESKMLKNVDVLEKERSKQSDDDMTKMLQMMNGSMERVDAGAQSILQHVERTERIKMLEFISSVKFGQNHARVSKQRSPGTGQWLLDHKDFLTWKQSESSTFWLQGTPGTGKTYLTSAVIDQLETPLQESPTDEGFAYFYCDRTDPSRQEAKHVLQSVVRQLSTTSKNPEGTQIKLYELWKQKQEEGFTELSFEECKDQILATLEEYPKTTILIDALDEIAERDDQIKFIEAVNSFVSKRKWSTKIFISSRPDAMFERELKAASNLAIDADDNLDDIQKFIELKIPELDRSVTSGVFSKMKTKIMDKLLKHCQGMFQWVALQIDQLEGCKTQTSIEKRLDNLPRTLEQAYEEIWQQIQEYDDEVEKLFAERAMLWVMAAQRPFTSEQLLAAVRVNPTGDSPVLDDIIQESDLRDLCKNLLAIDGEQGVWRFSHLSVREYLEKRMRWTPTRAQHHAATACLNLFVRVDDEVDARRQQKAKLDRLVQLSIMRKRIRDADERGASKQDVEKMELKYFWEEDSLMSFPGSESDSEDPEQIFDVRHPFHAYARHHLFGHVKSAQNDDGEHGTLEKTLKTFLGSPEESSQSYRRWYQQLQDNYGRLPNSLYYAAGFDDLGRDLNHLHQSDGVIVMSSQTGRDVQQLDSMISPPDAAIWAMCCYDLGAILQEWWIDEKKFPIDLQRLNSRRQSLLLVAASAGATYACNALIVERGFDVNQGNSVNFAVREGHTNTVRFLLKKAKARVDADGPGTSLALAVSGPKANISMVKLLREHGAALREEVRVNVGNIEEYPSALASAACLGKRDIVEYLLKEGAHPHWVNPRQLPQKTGYRASALGWALIFGHVDIVDCLLDAGADPNLKDHGFGLEATPLGLASYAVSDLGRISCVERLRRAGADQSFERQSVESIRKAMLRYRIRGDSPEAQIKEMQEGAQEFIMDMMMQEPRRVPHSRPTSSSGI